MKLSGQRAIVAGGCAGAVWKAKLLAACGATVEVYAPDPGPEMCAAPGEAVAGSVHLFRRAWRPEDLPGAAFAVGAFPQTCCAAHFARTARAAGVPVNLVDRPELCQVQFGAIVNRSPLVLGISTDGAAPVFAQALRSRIEALIPRGLAQWLAAAQRWRAAVTDALGTVAARRTFWERFTDRALGASERRPVDADYDALLAATRARTQATTGSIVLVGAGPGDPELLTLKAVRALRSADVVLYDELVAPAVLDFARREARIMLVGKTGHGPSCAQADINGLMIKLAQQGKRVVRLKGGDPMLFGRAGEELDAAAAAGIPAEIVPGVTAAQGAAAALGRSLTRRSLVNRVQFVTGHDHAGALPADLDTHALADPAATTVVYMPKRTLRDLLDKAMANGLPPETPAIAVIAISRPNERVIRGTAGTLAAQLAAENVQAPCTVLIGRTMAARVDIDGSYGTRQAPVLDRRRLRLGDD
jgi:uroporphyrin-III C-methyltransferase/precorrin-2 dehydrogenase/sirohydrochlorin ferrochelatase